MVPVCRLRCIDFAFVYEDNRICFIQFGFELIQEW